MKSIKIATRKSQLALWQAEYVASELQRHHPGLEVNLIKMSTQGDRILDTPLAKIGGKGLFIKELEQALLNGSADIAVHSTKDMPAHLPEGLHIGTICGREDPRDAFVSNHHKNLDDLPPQAKVGTSSLRRRCQLMARYPHLQILDLRGNVNTRLRKLDEREYDAIILAAAGLKRLGMAARITDSLETDICLPAVGQGAVCIETRQDDGAINDLLLPLHHQPTAACVLAERAMNARLEGGCQVPIAGHAVIHDGQLILRGLVGNLDGSTLLTASASGDISQPETIGMSVANQLLDQGAGKILDELKEAH